MGCTKLGCLMLMVAVILLQYISTGQEDTSAPLEEWNRTFGGTGTDMAHSVQQTSDGGYILAGWTESYGAGREDAWLIKTDSQGKEIWNRTFGGAGSDGAESVQPTVDGGYILAGYTKSYNSWSNGAWMIKTDSEGKEIWNRTFRGANTELARSVQPTPDGGYILAGETRSDNGDLDMGTWMIKTDSQGKEIWSTGFGTGYVYQVQATSDGGYIIAGVHRRKLSDAWLIKTDSNGNNVWDRTLDGAGNDWANSIQINRDGGYILAGWTTSFNVRGENEAWLIKTDAEGKEIWNRTFGRARFTQGSNWESENSVQVMSDDGYILSVNTDSSNSGVITNAALLIRTDSQGREMWRKIFGGTKGGMAFSVQPTSDDGQILVGWTGLHDADAWLIKVAPA